MASQAAARHSQETPAVVGSRSPPQSSLLCNVHLPRFYKLTAIVAGVTIGVNAVIATTATSPREVPCRQNGKACISRPCAYREAGSQTLSSGSVNAIIATTATGTREVLS